VSRSPTATDASWSGSTTSTPAPAGLRQQVEEHLARREFVPVIQRVRSISAAVEPSDWEVETDRGRTRFLLKSEDDVYQLSDHAALVTDAHGFATSSPTRGSSTRRAAGCWSDSCETSFRGNGGARNDSVLAGNLTPRYALVFRETNTEFFRVAFDICADPFHVSSVRTVGVIIP
jgi:hypothetical protein